MHVANRGGERVFDTSSLDYTSVGWAEMEHVRTRRVEIGYSHLVCKFRLDMSAPALQRFRLQADLQPALLHVPRTNHSSLSLRGVIRQDPLPGQLICHAMVGTISVERSSRAWIQSFKRDMSCVVAGGACTSRTRCLATATHIFCAAVWMEIDMHALKATPNPPPFHEHVRVCPKGRANTPALSAHALLFRKAHAAWHVCGSCSHRLIRRHARTRHDCPCVRLAWNATAFGTLRRG